VADTFDALTSDRPYRKAKPASDAYELIKDEEGRLFDPAMVTALEECWRRGEIARILMLGDQSNA
jgi:putative two-component system response regulator